MIYRLIYFGGPDDGLEVISPRPYEIVADARNEIYASKEAAPDCLIWVTDDERRIELHYHGRGRIEDFVRPPAAAERTNR